jgi:hypothetical protein
MTPINIMTANQKIGLTKLYLKTESEYFRKMGLQGCASFFQKRSLVTASNGKTESE